MRAFSRERSIESVRTLRSWAVRCATGCLEPLVIRVVKFTAVVLRVDFGSATFFDLEVM
jgi:hypothetical protein